MRGADRGGRPAPEPLRRPAPEQGSASVLAIGVVAGLALLLVTALALVSVLVAGQQARSAADLAALAAAGRVVSGAEPQVACREAGLVARQNRAELVSCGARPQPGQPWPAITLTVSRAVPGTPWTVSADAVAGTVTARSSQGRSPGRPSRPG